MGDEDLIALQKLWYEKLKKSGFEDIENISFGKNHGTLKTWHSNNFFYQYTEDEFRERMEYYEMLIDFYWHYTGFKNKREKEIWRLYSEGWSRRRIAIHLSKKKKISDSWIQKILSKLRQVMHTRTWPSSDKANDRTDNLPKLPSRR